MPWSSVGRPSANYRFFVLQDLLQDLFLHFRSVLLDLLRLFEFLQLSHLCLYHASPYWEDCLLSKRQLDLAVTVVLAEISWNPCLPSSLWLNSAILTRSYLIFLPQPNY